MRTHEDKVTIVAGASMVIGATIAEELTRERALIARADETAGVGCAVWIAGALMGPACEINLPLAA
ncbi:NAD(P)-dependent dehydrogenase (short-subunit alcohol dehydrogenase family) [Rhodococcus erythropolis]|uniref:hypothetical protein n=1 Tax=Rhodococcus erythropolis TaxID=1833 RepID=UPI00216954E1|nr:hypothetical protein [Rhodococcus erythropolis]MCS4258028.1 NAD(P)-dependent dehydrogenase (short-subunit alcohol dehydrogenase family) [Rhodococcus erythropolis]MCW2425184.1 NAD(P)-dependent dehydrogenase (short-subunit alcohol dehydrogenase family) [Rhodococcus erythropolis]